MNNKEDQNFLREGGIIVGNIEDKANLKNPISKFLIKKFDEVLLKFLSISEPASIHEVGCGEARLTKLISEHYGVPIHATDYSKIIIQRNQEEEIPGVTFQYKSIYELTADEDYADVIVCCEVLEHLENPEEAIKALKKLRSRLYIFSVPNEPVWRVLNILRGKYLTDLGNTPGHLNHWSKKEFLQLLSQFSFQPMRIESPLPWTMILGNFKY